MKSLLFIFLLSFPFCTYGQKTYEFNWKKELTIVGGSGLLTAGSIYIDRQSEPLTIPSPGSTPPNLNIIDRVALDNFSSSAQTSSDVFLYSLTAAPLVMLASDKLKENRIEYVLMYAEVIALNGSLTFLVKSAFNRKRPYFYNDNAPIEERQALDAAKSFFSGHTSHTAALSYFTSSVFSELFPDSDWKPVLWISAATLPAITGYLRVRAGRHFPTDVIVGYGVGAGIGLLIPYLHKVQLFESNDLTISSSNNGVMVKFTF